MTKSTWKKFEKRCTRLGRKCSYHIKQNPDQRVGGILWKSTWSHRIVSNRNRMRRRKFLHSLPVNTSKQLFVTCGISFDFVLSISMRVSLVLPFMFYFYTWRIIGNDLLMRWTSSRKQIRFFDYWSNERSVIFLTISFPDNRESCYDENQIVEWNRENFKSFSLHASIFLASFPVKANPPRWGSAVNLRWHLSALTSVQQVCDANKFRLENFPGSL